MDCIFCKITAGELPSYTVHEDDLVTAFLDIHPISKGHTLIVPKQHAQDLLAIPQSTLAHIAEVSQQLAARYQSVLKPDGYTVLQYNGQAGQQEVNHYHMHLVPRYKGDGIDANPRHDKKQIDVEATFSQLTSSPTT